MASIPQRQDAQRSQDQTPYNQPHSPVRPRSATSEDSQTLLLNNPPTDLLKQQQHQQSKGHVPAEPTPAPAGQDDDDSVKKCWICFADSTEDTPETSPWRDPCPCALVAHEECLLDWIADTEAPKNNRSRSIGSPQILCPQCKAEIKLARPTDYVVESVRGLERIGGKFVTPSALLLVGGVLVRGSVAHGIHSIYRVFGADDGYRILRPWMRQQIMPPIDFDSSPVELRMRAFYGAQDFRQHWRLYFGLPLITPLLILSRTTLADSTLPVLPVLFFASQAAQAHHGADGNLDFTVWPPSAGMTFAILPYVRAAYNNLYERFFGAKERQWIREIQPRITQAEANGEAPPNPDQANENRGEENGNVFEVRIDGDIWENWVEEEGEQVENDNNDRARQEVIDNAPAPPQQPPQNHDQLPVPEQPQNDREVAEPPPNIPDNRAQQQQQAQQAQQAQQGERRLSFSPTSLAETLLGALLFPTLAELSGEVLRLALPRTWTGSAVGLVSSSHSRVVPKGLLQEKWARSLVGGCLFVVAKDAVMLYVRWRMAQMHRCRRVLDWERQGRGSWRR